MSSILLLDIGASRVKALLFDTDMSAIIDKEECISPSIKSCSSIKNRFEIPVEKYWESLLSTIGKIVLRHPKRNLNTLWVCSEMHGFVLADMSGSALTPYISWKDQRANFDNNDGLSTFEELNKEFRSFRQITGMNVKPGLPVLTLASGIRSGTIPQLMNLDDQKDIRVLSIVDWLLFRGGEKNPKANITLACGLGIYDINTGVISQEILQSQYFSNLKIAGLDIERDIFKPLGKIAIYNSEISIYGGIGDFQAAIHGSALLESYDAVINMGTGSQVAILTQLVESTSQSEVRVLVDGGLSNVISHIPCGRALNVISTFLSYFSSEDDKQDFFWKIWSSLSYEEVMKSSLVSNLALFESAWGRVAGHNGYIGLDESCSSALDVVAGIARSWLAQYSNALNMLDPLNMRKRVVISGGVAQKSNFVVPVLESLMPNRAFYLAPTKTGEETFDGLLRLAIDSKI